MELKIGRSNSKEASSYKEASLTVIVSYEADGKVYLGGDSYCSSGVVLDRCDTSKVFQIGPVGVGVCGSIRAEQILTKVLKREISKKRKINKEWIEQKLTDLVRVEMIKSGLVEPGQNMPDESCFVIAFEGKSYLFEEDFSIWRSSSGYQAIGAGTPFAKGAMEVLYNNQNLSPVEKVNMALEASGKLCALVLPPYTIIDI